MALKMDEADYAQKSRSFTRYNLNHDHVPESCKVSISWSSTISLTHTLKK